MINLALKHAVVVSVTTSMLLPALAPAGEDSPWDQDRVTTLAADLHVGVAGLLQEIRSVSQGLGSGRAAAYYRLVDNLRVIERETQHLHKALESGATRPETLPTYRRIALLRRDCEEEMERLFLGSPAQKRISRARTIVKELNPYYGFSPDQEDHKRVLER